MERIIQTDKGLLIVKKLQHDGLNKMVIKIELEKLIAQHLDVETVEIHHEKSGKPFLIAQPNCHISISHSANWIAVYMSKKPWIGVDIELEKEAIKKVKDYFINATEIELFKSFSLSYLQLIWGAKEAIYKYFSGEISSIQSEITVLSIDYQKGKLTASAKGQTIPCDFAIIDEEVYLVYC